MKKLFLPVLALVVASASLPLILFASNEGFVLAAVSPDKQKVSCIRSQELNILSALQHNGFAPKQDDTGFIYSLIGYDGPVSSDPTAQQNFWGLWEADGPTGTLQFSNFGPASIGPRDSHVYLLAFGDGSQPVLPAAAQTICNDQPAQQSPPTIPSPEITQGGGSFTYLLNNYAQASKAEQDWAAMALGSGGRDVPVGNTASVAVTSQARVALAKTAQGHSAAAELAAIVASFDGNQIGEKSLVNDDIFGVLALAGANRPWLDTHQQVFAFIVSSQRSNGSFGFSLEGDGDVDMTAAALWALRLSTGYAAQISAATNYLLLAQNNDGGFGFRPGQPSNVPSTAWTALGLRAVDQNNAATENYLIANRQSDGSYLFAGQKSYLATSYAVLALSGKQLPIIRLATPPPQPPSPPGANTSSPASKKQSAKTSVVVSTVETFHGCSASASASASAGDGWASASASAIVRCW
ncbi:MAG: prenyltransferase/squalene oxidase repeat-containing protein [Patescibacteria group bacterium]